MVFFRLVQNLSRRIQRSRLRRAMRGYRILESRDSTGRIEILKQALTEHSLCFPQRSFSSALMGAATDRGEIVVRQFLLTSLGGVRMNLALLSALGKERSRVVFPMPKEWRYILEKHGFLVANFWSSLLWQIYVLAQLMRGVAKIGKTTFYGITSGKRADFLNRYVYFSDLSPSNLPNSIPGIQSHDVVSWYLQWPGRKLDIDTVRHSVTNALSTTIGSTVVQSQRWPLPAMMGWNASAKYFIWGLRAIVIATLDCMRGRWWHAILLRESALVIQAQLLPAESLAREYLFHNSNVIYRPLWTYEAELRGSTISFYFYSTNCEKFKCGDEYPLMPSGWKAMNWSRYLVWDEFQANFVRRAVGPEVNIKVVGSIWFQASSDRIPVIDKTAIAVFDITPHRASRYCVLGLTGDYYPLSVANSFLVQVSTIARTLGVLMVWKEKRSIGRKAHPHYRQIVDQIASDSNVLIVEPGNSAIDVIELCTAVISMPFTSTALIAREMGKPSIYYDPSCSLQRDDRAAHGIPIVLGIDELEAWLSAYNSKKH
jgi:polysaccharide biosynthesis PFTS motif protein